MANAPLLLRSIELYRPPPFRRASIDDLYFVDLLSRRGFPQQILRFQFGRNPSGKPTRNAFTSTWIERRVYRDVNLTSGFGPANLIHTDIVEFQHLR